MGYHDFDTVVFLYDQFIEIQWVTPAIPACERIVMGEYTFNGSVRTLCGVSSWVCKSSRTSGARLLDSSRRIPGPAPSCKIP